VTPAVPPTEADLSALAERALSNVTGDGQVTAWWERSLQASAGAHLERSLTSVELLVFVDGRSGVAVTGDLGEDGLQTAAGRAREAAGRQGVPSRPLAAPAGGRPHAGFDPAILRLDPTDLVADGQRWRAGAAKTVIISTRGVSAYEQRSFASLAIDLGGASELTAAGVSPATVGAEALIAEVADLAAVGELAGVPAGELPVVLGPDAVAAILDRLRPELVSGGVLDARRGTRVVASCVNLSDSPRFATTLPRSYDVMGAPRQPVPLIQDGVAHRVVSLDTGHAVAPGDATALPEHLVLVGGGAADVEELMAPIERGLYLPTLEGGFEIVAGRRERPLAPARARVDALRVLATTQALGRHQRAIASGRSARTVGATVCPALRATGGITLHA